jgi:hypothetical protein
VKVEAVTLKGGCKILATFPIPATSPITPTGVTVAAGGTVTLTPGGSWIIDDASCGACGCKNPAGLNAPVPPPATEGCLVVYVYAAQKWVPMKYFPNPVQNPNQMDFKNTGPEGLLGFGPNCDPATLNFNNLSLSVMIVPN